MDKYSAKNLSDKVKEIVSEAHLGSLNDKDIAVNIRISEKRLKMPQNIMLFQAFAYLAAKRLRPVSNRVLMFLFSMSAYENYIGMDIKSISEELGMTVRSVISALKELEEAKIIIKLEHPADKRRHDYFINPIAAWKGNSFTRVKQLKTIAINNPSQLELFNEKMNE